MCVCNPIVRTPFCGKPGCEWPAPSEAATAAQPKPHGIGPEILPLVIADLEARTVLGRVKYGEVLRATNGRDALIDAYQEVLDLAQYLRQEIEERRLLRMIPRPPAYPAVDAHWLEKRCEMVLVAGVKDGMGAWAAGLRDIRAHAATCVALTEGART